MKQFATLFITMFFCFSLFAEDIPLPKKDAGAGGYGMGNDKELVVGVRASIEDGVLTIMTDVATNGVVATIYDSTTTIVYTTVSAVEGKLHEFIVGELPTDIYVLEVQIGDSIFSGEFTIE